MNVHLATGWNVVVKNKRNLLNVDTTGENIRTNKNSCRSSAKLGHN